MKKLSRLLLALGLLLCLACGSLSAYAEEAPAALPTAKEPRTLTPRTGIETSLWKARAFLTQHGTAYRFAPCAVQTPADAAGAAPAEDAVAVLRLYTTYEEKDTLLNTDGHVFLSVTNNTAADLVVGGLSIAPGTTLTIGTRGNNREHAGIWYNVECYNMYYLPAFYVNLTCLQLSMDAEQLAAVNAALAEADKWSAWHNCAAFGAAVWNAVCSDKVDPGTPPTPASLAASVRSYADKWNADPAVPFDYIVYYGYPAAPSKEFA